MNEVPNEILIEFSNILNNFDLLTDSINVSGKLTRCKTIGDKGHTKSGVYFIKPDYPYNYYVMNFRTQSSVKDNFTLNKTRPIRTVQTKKITQVTKSTVADVNQKADLCKSIYEKALTNERLLLNHGYIINKNIAPLNIRIDKHNFLIIPGVDITGKIYTIQKIAEDGTKRYISGTKKNEIFHIVGHNTFVIPDNVNEVYIAEGYATAVSLHMATNAIVITAFDAQNVLKVGLKLRERFPLLNIVYCMDLDFVGIKYGIEAAKLTKGVCIIPSSNNKNLIISDFNDLHTFEGINQQSINLQKANMKLILVQSYKLLHNQLTLSDIHAEFHGLADDYIRSYYAPDVARKITDLAYEQQINEINKINSSYQSLVRAELIKILSQKYLYCKINIAENFLEEVNSYIVNNLLDNLAKKISTEESLNERRTLLNKVNPFFHEQMKFLITKKYFYERNSK